MIFLVIIFFSVSTGSIIRNIFFHKSKPIFHNIQAILIFILSLQLFHGCVKKGNNETQTDYNDKVTGNFLPPPPPPTMSDNSIISTEENIPNESIEQKERKKGQSTLEETFDDNRNQNQNTDEIEKPVEQNESSNLKPLQENNYKNLNSTKESTLEYKQNKFSNQQNFIQTETSEDINDTIEIESNKQISSQSLTLNDISNETKSQIQGQKGVIERVQKQEDIDLMQSNKEKNQIKKPSSPVPIHTKRTSITGPHIKLLSNMRKFRDKSLSDIGWVQYTLFDLINNIFSEKDILNIDKEILVKLNYNLDNVIKYVNKDTPLGRVNPTQLGNNILFLFEAAHIKESARSIDKIIIDIERLNKSFAPKYIIEGADTELKDPELKFLKFSKESYDFLYESHSVIEDDNIEVAVIKRRGFLHTYDQRILTLYFIAALYMMANKNQYAGAVRNEIYRCNELLNTYLKDKNIKYACQNDDSFSRLALKLNEFINEDSYIQVRSSYVPNNNLMSKTPFPQLINNISSRWNRMKSPKS